VDRLFLFPVPGFALWCPTPHFSVARVLEPLHHIFGLNLLDPHALPRSVRRDKLDSPIPFPSFELRFFRLSGAKGDLMFFSCLPFTCMPLFILGPTGLLVSVSAPICLVAPSPFHFLPVERLLVVAYVPTCCFSHVLRSLIFSQPCPASAPVS